MPKLSDFHTGWSIKTLIMNYLNNYFQKGIIVLVVAMLLTITNMRVYSAIGSYQISSPAITVNNKKHSNTIGMMVGFPDAIAFGIGVICVVLAVGFLAIGRFANIDIGEEGLDRSDLVIKNYHEYDFSQFDN